jgi:hypothetical protein
LHAEDFCRPVAVEEELFLARLAQITFSGNMRLASATRIFRSVSEVLNLLEKLHSRRMLKFLAARVLTNARLSLDYFAGTLTGKTQIDRAEPADATGRASHKLYRRFNPLESSTRSFGKNK